MHNRLKTHEAWHDSVHSQYFDGWFNLSLRGLKKTYESFDEIKLFLEFKPTLRRNMFLEIGCATGELYRYINHYHKNISYYGIDISEPAIERAKSKYPQGKFFITEENKRISETVKVLNIRPSILFARDVIIHQPNPFEFLEDLVSIPSELAILRIRTRDKGATLLDPENSCQWHYGKWIPYMVMNIDEVIKSIRKTVPVESLYVIKKYIQLGGHVGRYLPKDCYYPETGTAETAICVKLSEKQTVDPKIVIEVNNDSNTHISVFDRKLSYLFRKIKEGLLNK